MSVIEVQYNDQTVILNTLDYSRTRGFHNTIEKMIKQVKKECGITRLSADEKTVVYNLIRNELMKIVKSNSN